MKAILLMRHAKSDWNHPGLDDFDRPLNERGRDDAPRMGRVLARTGMVPGRIVASPAARARETAELLAEAAGYGGETRWEERLYGAPGAVWLDLIRSLPDKLDSVLVIAHSPGVSEAAAALVFGSSRRPHGHVLRFPTAGVACVDVNADRWGGIGPGCGQLRWLLIPRLVKAIV